MELYRTLPKPLQPLNDLANDVRWTWSHAGDQLWRSIDKELWQFTKNPYVILQTVEGSRLEKLARDSDFLAQLDLLVRDRQHYLERAGWYSRYADSPMQTVAYFCMEYGLGEALPLYAGGLGILAGDYLKAASDLCVPLVAVGLLYDQGYFRQILDSHGWQQELYPHCDTASLPITPVLSESGEWRYVTLELPGRLLLLRLWKVQVGLVTLYLLDSNHPRNSLVDQGIGNQLYPPSVETRFIQQLVLGVGGWRALRELSVPVDVCHLNESHCAFVILERVKELMHSQKLAFDDAMVVVRAGNVLTSHTPVAAAFENFSIELVEKYLSVYAKAMGVSLRKLINVGLVKNNHGEKVFSPMKLAVDGCLSVNAVSQSHGVLMKRNFQYLYPRWPRHEVPINYITNGIHVPSWDSQWADQLWTDAGGKERWLGDLSHLPQAIDRQTDERLWAFKCEERMELIAYVRKRLALELKRRGATENEIARAENILDPNALTLGVSRRFTEYKRPNLLLKNKQRLMGLLKNHERPVQIIVAGKAHPLDHKGKEMIQAWVEFSQQQQCHHHVVFLEDYDIALAQELVQGVDVWINTPRHPWEACGTSGMKVLVNGGLNLSELDGWWVEAYKPQYGWAVGDGEIHDESNLDDEEAEQLYLRLEKNIIPEFYHRDSEGLPREWLARIRSSMADLTPCYSSNRMVREYVENYYIEAANRYHQRADDKKYGIAALLKWQRRVKNHWADIHWGEKYYQAADNGFVIDVQVYLGLVPTEYIQVQLYAQPYGEQSAEKIIMSQQSDLVGTVGGYLYRATVVSSRPQCHYTPRIIAWHEQAVVPGECKNILWWGD